MFSFLCTLFFSKPHAQPLFNPPSISTRFFWGSYLTHLPKAQYLRDSYSYFGEVALQRQTDGHKDWHVANGWPHVGLALQFGNTGSKRYMGNVAALFPFVSWTLQQRKRFSSSVRAGTGLGWVQKTYDKLSNPKAVLIGTHANAYLNVLWQAEVQTFSNTHVAVGLGFSHFSNGSTTLPNLGLNIPVLSVGLRYGIDDTAKHRRTPAPFDARFHFSLFTALGLKQFPWIESRRYAVNAWQAECSQQFWQSGAINFGAVAFYDRALEVDPAGIPDRKRSGSKLQAGVFVGYEHLFGRLSVPVQMGAYMYNQGIHTSLFQQVGFRYRINRQWRAQLGMKTHSGKADFIHAGIGYCIK